MRKAGQIDLMLDLKRLEKQEQNKQKTGREK
jgi:hypothetical protein